jgi:hypothetical protein
VYGLSWFYVKRRDAERRYSDERTEHTGQSADTEEYSPEVVGKEKYGNTEAGKKGTEVMTQALREQLKKLYGVRGLKAILAGNEFSVRGITYGVTRVDGELRVSPK